MDMDQAFIDMMVPHHQAAVEMGQIAEERAEHEELRTLADAIVSAQGTEIEQLREWRRAWFGSSDTPSMDAMPLLPGMDMPGMKGNSMNGTMDMTADIEVLRTADPFDRALIKATVPHHETAIAAARAIGESTERSELKQVAEDMTESPQGEIDQMQGWLAVWYPG